MRNKNDPLHEYTFGIGSNGKGYYVAANGFFGMFPAELILSMYKKGERYAINQAKP